MVFENGLTEVRDSDFVLAQTAYAGFVHIALDVRMSSFGLTQNQNRQLQLDRSRRPFGVSSSDWYQNEARELYFLFL